MTKNKKALIGKLEYWMFVLPVLVPYVLFFIIPFGMAAFYSLFEWNGVSDIMKYVGLDNYVNLFSNDGNYMTSLIFTAKFVVLNVIATNLLALGLALFVNQKIKGSKFARAAILMPNVIAGVVIGFIWVFIFNRVTAVLYKATELELFNLSWLGDKNLSIVSLVITSVWRNVGYTMIIYLAGLNAIDKSYLEAASIDGANTFRKFFTVTLPLLMPSITVNLFMVTAQSFKLFDLNIALTNGGPGRATMGLALDIYIEAFKNGRLGYGATKSVILFIIVVLVTVLQVSLTKKREVQI